MGLTEGAPTSAAAGWLVRHKAAISPRSTPVHARLFLSDEWRTGLLVDNFTRLILTPAKATGDDFCHARREPDHPAYWCCGPATGLGGGAKSPLGIVVGAETRRLGGPVLTGSPFLSSSVIAWLTGMRTMPAFRSTQP